LFCSVLGLQLAYLPIGRKHYVERLFPKSVPPFPGYQKCGCQKQHKRKDSGHQA
jgi:hypothetical protein